ncbi:MAG: glycosyltransferase family 39 protein [Candidatus Daviesbacteria bacterium]|nr:glycosyltransferase family 39 protein [Candidatus Daviesbacteria bacterium]
MKKILTIFIDPKFILAIILLLALMVRLYKIDSPIADWHSWRQADTAAVTRDFIEQGFNPFLPKYEDMSGAAEHPMINIGRYRFVEFPLYNILVYPLYLIFGVAEKYSRLVSALLSIGSIIFVYLLAKRYQDSLTALIAAAVFAFLPFNVFFSRTTLPEPTFVFFALGMLYFVDRWIYEQRPRLLWLGLFFTTLAFLLKPWAIFFALPLLYSMQKYENKFWFFKSRYLIFWVLALTPFLLWRVWIDQYPEGIPASSWLYNSDGIRFRPAFWWWLVSERIGGEILAVPGAILFAIGSIMKPKANLILNQKIVNAPYFLHFWLLSTFAYFAIFATGNVRHNYYQILFVPVASIFVAIGISYLIRGSSSFVPRFWTIILCIILFPLMFYFSYTQVIGLYQINNYPIVEAGRKADQILPKDARVLAPYNGDTAFLYQTNRPGWPIEALPVKDLISKYGVTNYVSVSKDAKTKWMMKYFTVLVDNPDYVIVDLTHLQRPFENSDREP